MAPIAGLVEGDAFFRTHFSGGSAVGRPLWSAVVAFYRQFVFHMCWAVFSLVINMGWGCRCGSMVRTSPASRANAALPSIDWPPALWVKGPATTRPDKFPALRARPTRARLAVAPLALFSFFCFSFWCFFGNTVSSRHLEALAMANTEYQTCIYSPSYMNVELYDL